MSVSGLICCILVVFMGLDIVHKFGKFADMRMQNHANKVDRASQLIVENKNEEKKSQLGEEIVEDERDQ